MRPSCYSCRYTNINRPADFTLGDFWRVDDAVENFNDNKGVSLFLVNSEKGTALFDTLREQADCCRVDVNHCLAKNPNLHTPTKKPSHREWLWKTYFEKGVKIMLSRNRLINLMRRAKRKIRILTHKG